MEREELLGLVSAELGDYRPTLSERTINEELDDVLSDFGDDDEANKQLVTRIANRLKRMDGNLHSEVSQQVKDYKRKLKTKSSAAPQPKPDGDGEGESDNDVLSQLRALTAKFEAAENERKAEQTARRRKDLSESVKNGLRSKFSDAGIAVNGFFLDTAMQKVELRDDASVQTLVDELEKLYNADMKAAGVDQDSRPMFGSGSGSKTAKTVDDFFAQKAKREGWSKK